MSQEGIPAPARDLTHLEQGSTRRPSTSWGKVGQSFALPEGEQQRQRLTSAVGEHLQLGGQPTAGAANGVVVGLDPAGLRQRSRRALCVGRRVDDLALGRNSPKPWVDGEPLGARDTVTSTSRG